MITRGAAELLALMDCERVLRAGVSDELGLPRNVVDTISHGFSIAFINSAQEYREVRTFSVRKMLYYQTYWAPIFPLVS